MAQERGTENALNLREQAPSPLVRQYAERIVQSARQLAILDVACGGGRNGAMLANLGARVVGIDIDFAKMDAARNAASDSPAAQALLRISLKKMDLVRDPWPYEPGSIGAIINIHFLHLPLLKSFADSLIPEGFLVIETVQNRGGNYVSLPRPGQLREALETAIDFQVYQETHAGPPNSEAVTVRVVGSKRKS